jgi:NitT/TauT family transport system ATP-binding protein
MSTLEILGVTKSFGTAEAGILALSRVDLTIGEGEFVCLLGPSGCGKSTLLNIIAGFVDPTDGVVQLDGQAVTGPGPDRGVVFQEHALFPWLTVQENVGFGLKMRGVEPRKTAETVRRFIDFIGLHGFAPRFPKDLSGGMRQRVAIARALANDPKILLMDEPFGALDAQTRMLMQDELIRIWLETRKTVVFVTHSIEESLLLADRIVVMSARPGTIKEIIEVKDPRPRDDTVPELAALKRHIGLLLKHEISKSLDLAPLPGA